MSTLDGEPFLCLALGHLCLLPASAFAGINFADCISHGITQSQRPNWSVKRTPTQAMPSAFSWPVLVPYAPSVLRRRLPW